MEKKFSLCDTYQLDELKKCMEIEDETFSVSIKVCEKGKNNPRYEIEGEMTPSEIMRFVDERKAALHSNSQRDELTGLFNADYFEKRIATIDRSEVLPVAIINFNINSWKFVNDNFGDDESDRLIKIIAGIIESEAKPYFVIGRMDGDIFGVLIPMALEGEAEKYVESVVSRCNDYEDSVLAPSVAAGIAYKTNIEQKIEDIMSDAEYEMFARKYEMKNTPEYTKRLEHGLKIAD
ncbi:MAG: GGDEF domain-containing protein [Lachnospiraceae bacterium]|nr:GGDEF domain-containing protein [Lachnospiraceae bacterium]